MHLDIRCGCDVREQSPIQFDTLLQKVHNSNTYQFESEKKSSLGFCRQNVGLTIFYGKLGRLVTILLLRFNIDEYWWDGRQESLRSRSTHPIDGEEWSANDWLSLSSRRLTWRSTPMICALTLESYRPPTHLLVNHLLLCILSKTKVTEWANTEILKRPFLYFFSSSEVLLSIAIC